MPNPLRDSSTILNTPRIVVNLDHQSLLRSHRLSKIVKKRRFSMFEVGQQVTVITDKGIGYSCYILARASGDNGMKAYKVSSDEGGMGQMGQ